MSYEGAYFLKWLLKCVVVKCRQRCAQKCYLSVAIKRADKALRCHNNELYDWAFSHYIRTVQAG